MRAALIGFLILAAADPARAGEADVLEASATCSPESVCTFSVAVRHADEGWDHYADRWQVLSMDGEILATRILRPPHVEEQPFVTVRGVERHPLTAPIVALRRQRDTASRGSVFFQYFVHQRRQWRELEQRHPL